ncbi:MAG: L-serine ammonia-lyase [Brevibacterium sp.]|nr:L-serine ammonia-lyase [Brevibacterium sp.]
MALGVLDLFSIGHGSDSAVLAGLSGHEPETLDPDIMAPLVTEVRAQSSLNLGGRRPIAFDPETDMVLHLRESLPGHPNGMRLSAEVAGSVIERDYYSIGGGFVITEAEMGGESDVSCDRFHFSSADELLALCRDNELSIAELIALNERQRQDESELRKQLLEIWAVMRECVDNGCSRTEEQLPGGLKVRRRAPELRSRLEDAEYRATGSLDALEWVNLYALAVNEENASGGRIVTAPTNGAAGIIPAVLHYMDRFVIGDDESQQVRDEAVVTFLLTSGAIGILFKRNASISGAEVGCQGEVGSACAMAAAGLCAVLGGSPEQVENAAEIGLEHNLGLTCDPVGGLFQVPCIERNAIAAVKAINAARLSMHGDGSHRVSLDQAIETMRQTGADMKSKYKETSLGGLAVNVVEC